MPIVRNYGNAKNNASGNVDSNTQGNADSNNQGNADSNVQDIMHEIEKHHYVDIHIHETGKIMSKYTHTRDWIIYLYQLCRHIYSSFFPYILSPYSLVVLVILTKIKAVLNCIAVVSVVHDYPKSHCLCQHHAQKQYGGTIHVLKLEKVELIDGDIHQEWSLARQLKN